VLTDADRCIGCRYCEVACPYGVNYYNWRTPEEAFSDYGTNYDDSEVSALTGGVLPPYKNPDLDELQGTEQRLTAGSTHEVGVMEKCTFCVQRVDKGLEPACVDVCPVRALVFGDIGDDTSPISRYVAEHSGFKLLEELGTEPSVFYLNGTPPGPETREIERPLTEVGS
jgi:molybdopterin-containing oxidoreductase family iron-sulfur binding subunit